MFTKTLWGKDKKDGFKIWIVEVYGTADLAELVISHGKEGGKMTVKSEKFTEGKQGRNAYEQAVSEAESKVKKNTDKGYREIKAELEELPLLAMLAADYRKQGHRIKYPCYSSVKYDGVRCLAKCTSIGVVELESRTGQKYDIPHIAEALSRIMDIGDVLDGEVYKHGEILQDITSSVKRTDTTKEIEKCKRKLDKLKKSASQDEVDEATAELNEALRIHVLRPQLEFHVFDIPGEEEFSIRLSLLQHYFDSRVSEEHPVLKLTAYEMASSEEEMKSLHRGAVAQGYEGVMLRNFDGLYESGKRSGDLQKYKEFFDSEFVIVGHSFDKDGLIMWKLQNDLQDNTFDAKLGSDDDRKAQAINPEKRYGCAMTLKYQARYKGTLIPQFGTGVAFRDGHFEGSEFIPEI